MTEVFYIVNQVFFDANGTAGTQDFVFRESEGERPAIDRALAKYHSILSFGAVSQDQYCSAILLRSDGAIIKPFEYFDRMPVPDDSADTNESVEEE